MKTKYIFIAAIAISFSMTLIPIQSLEAETSSQSQRLEKLERAIEQLEAEVKSLKKERAIAAAVPAEGPSKTKVVSDGKSYVEQSVPIEKSAAMWLPMMPKPMNPIFIFAFLHAAVTNSGS